jgi:hypothetical protein
MCSLTCDFAITKGKEYMVHQPVCAYYFSPHTQDKYIVYI